MALFTRRDSYLGLDIGTSSVKIVELRREGRGAASLVTYASASRTLPLTDGPSGEAVARMVALLRDMLKRAKTTSTDVVAALPSLSVFSSVLQLPEMSERDLEQAVQLAAKNYVPSPLKDVVLGWTVIQDGEQPVPTTSPAEAGAVPEKTGVSSVIPLIHRPPPRTQQEVFLTAAPKDLVQRYSQVVERLGLRLVALEIESFPLARSLIEDEARPVLIVDIGDRATTFSVVSKGYLRLNQSVDIGGGTLTEAIAKTMGIAFEEAETRKRAEGLLDENVGARSVAGVLRTALRDLIERAQNLRRLFEQKSRRQIARTVLIGGGTSLLGLPAFWTEVTNMPSEVGDPWKGIRTPPVLGEKLKGLGPSFAVAVGLALREVKERG
jgi:type IV pilus assembly protein PilM